MEGGIYVLCALTAAGSSCCLLRGFVRSGSRLLLWCGIFFGTLGLENILLFVDFILVPEFDLSLIRRIVPLVGVLLLLYGLIFDSR